ncbi:MAG: ABC transporter ATP-binding protein [Coleofasciculaceae cyanobacterium]
MAQVVLENVYKSFPSRKGEPTVTPVTTESLLTPVEQTAIQVAESSHQSGINVLRRISLTIKNGEFMVLVGPSGCGKSTLLRVIAGLEPLTGGKIWVGDTLVNELLPKERHIAMVFQNYALYPHLSVYDNIAFGLRRMTEAEGEATPSTISKKTTVADVSSSFWQWSDNWLVEGRQLLKEKFQQFFNRDLGEHLLWATTRVLPRGFHYISAKEKIIDEQVRTVAKLLQIEPLLNRLPKELSGGQKQRVALGRAIARNPQVFLMDEPLSNLDAKLRAETRSQIVKLQRQLGTTTIYVTHDQTEAMTMGDRIAVMNHGQIQQIAPPLELYNRPINQFVAQFIGSPPMNFIPVQIKAPLLVQHAQFRLTLPADWEPFLKKYDGQTLTLGIRPEHLNVGVPAPKNLPVTVDLVEALGNETYLSVTLDKESTLQVRIPADQLVQLGEKVWLAIAPDKIHLFNRHTGLAIRSN